jgi:hypothetical protein
MSRAVDYGGTPLSCRSFAQELMRALMTSEPSNEVVEAEARPTDTDQDIRETATRLLRIRACRRIRPQAGTLVKRRYMLAVMCGRSTYKLTWEEILRLYRLTLDAGAIHCSSAGLVREVWQD